MDTEPLNLLGYNVPIMRLLIKGALALFEDEWDDKPQETADLMGQALYLLRVYTQECQKALFELAKPPKKEEE